MQLPKLPYYAVLMAGGGDTRLWPLSRPKKPKQLLPLVGGRSLFELAIERLLAFFPPQYIFVATNSKMRNALYRHDPRVPEENYLCEPSPRNTAPAIAFVLASLRSRDASKFVMACLPSDHYIDNAVEFQSLLHAAGNLAEQGHPATLGIEPTDPNTGYGYLEKGESLGRIEGHPAYRVRRFKEKPSAEEARKLVGKGGHFWNSGMFFWRSDVLEDDYRRQQKIMAQGMDQLMELFAKNGSAQAIDSVWKTMPILSLDHAILENAHSVVVLPTGKLGWTDIGSWDSLVDLYQRRPDLRPDSQANQYDIDSRSVTVIREGMSGHILATIELNEVIIVETEDAILICEKGKSKDVRKIVDRLGKKDRLRKNEVDFLALEEVE